MFLFFWPLGKEEICTNMTVFLLDFDMAFGFYINHVRELDVCLDICE